MKRTIGILLAVLMLTALMGTAYADSSGLGIEPGQAFPDFTVSLTDGTTATLSELLKEKDLVVLNVFASWCGPWLSGAQRPDGHPVGLRRPVGYHGDDRRL